MSQENVELLGRVADAYNRHDPDTYVALMDANVEITSRFIGPASYYGHGGVRTYLQGWWEAFPDLRVEIQEVRDLGHLLLFALRAHGHGSASAAPFEELAWITAKARDGRCIWWHAHAGKAQALEAAGLRE